MFQRFGLLSMVAVASLLSGSVGAAERAAKPAEWVVGPVHVQTIGPATLFYTSAEATMANIAQVAEKTTADLDKALRENKVEVAGPLVFMYEGSSGEADKPFKLKVGMIVADNTQPAAGYKVMKLEPFRCATMLYTGAMPNMPKAYEKLFPAIFAAGHQPGELCREYYLYWEGMNSPNNVVQIQMELAPAKAP